MKDLNDKVVVITGAGSGMGREMALLAARRGALLAVSDWNEEALAEPVDLLKEAGVRELRSDVVDVSDRAAMGEWATAVVEQFGRVDCAFNCAGRNSNLGVAGSTGEDLDAEFARRVGQAHRRFGSPRVLERVGQALLDDPVHGQPGADRDRLRMTLLDQLGRVPGGADPGHQVGQRLGDRGPAGSGLLVRAAG